MANSFITIGGATKTTLALFKNTNSFLKLINRQFEGEFGVRGNKIGTQIAIRLPNDFVPRTGQTANFQSITENKTVLTVATQKGLDYAYLSFEKTMDADYAEERYLKPGVNKLIAAMASDVMTSAQIPYVIRAATTGGTLGYATGANFSDARALLVKSSVETYNLRAIIHPNTNSNLVKAGLTLFNPANTISDQYLGGRVSKGFGLDFYEDQTVDTQVAGSWTTATLTSAAGQSGGTLAVVSLAAAMVLGDVITVAGVNQINRLTGISTGNLQQFVVTSAASIGATQITVYPPLTPPSGGSVGGSMVAYQTVTNSPNASAVITNVFNSGDTYFQNLIFHPEAVTIAFAELDLPKGVNAAARESLDGISVRMVEAWFPNTDLWGTRLDVLYGYAWIRPEFACVVAERTS